MMIKPMITYTVGDPDNMIPANTNQPPDARPDNAALYPAMLNNKKQKTTNTRTSFQGTISVPGNEVSFTFLNGVYPKIVVSVSFTTE
jgi:hypothetical protein